MESLPKILRNASRGENEYRPSTPPLILEVEEISSRTFRYHVRDSKKRKRENRWSLQRSLREYNERHPQDEEEDIQLVDRWAVFWEMARNLQSVRLELEKEEFERYWGMETEDDGWMVKGVEEKGE